MSRAAAPAFATVTAIATLLFAQAAAADDRWWVRTENSIALGITDNVLRTVGGDSGERESDVFTQLTPALLLSRAGPRGTRDIVYKLDLLIFPGTEVASSISHRLSLSEVRSMSPSTTLSLGGATAYGQSNAFTIVQTPEEGTADAIPRGSLNSASAGLIEALRWRLSRDWVFLQRGASPPPRGWWPCPR